MADSNTCVLHMGYHHYFWTLQPPHGGSFGRTVRISSHCWWHSHIWPGHRRTCQPCQSVPAAMCRHEHYPKHGEMQILSNRSHFCWISAVCWGLPSWQINYWCHTQLPDTHQPLRSALIFWVAKPAIHMQQFHGIIADSPAPFAQHKKWFCMDTAPWRCFHEGQRVPHYSSNVTFYWPEQVHTALHWCKQTRARFHLPTEVNRWYLDPSSGRFTLPVRCRITICHHWARNVSCMLGNVKMQDLPIRTTALCSHHRSQPLVTNPQLLSLGWDRESQIATT